MRNDGGIDVIKKAIDKLSRRHKEHIAAYGEGNERRLTGRHETADINTFSWVCLLSLTFFCFSICSSFLDYNKYLSVDYIYKEIYLILSTKLFW